MRVEAIKIKDGYFIPAVGTLSTLEGRKIMLDVNIVASEKSYKDLSAEGACERYFDKQQREIPSKLTSADLVQIDEEFSLSNINSIDDILEIL